FFKKKKNQFFFKKKNKSGIKNGNNESNYLDDSISVGVIFVYIRSSGSSKSSSDGDNDLKACKKCWSNPTEVSNPSLSRSKETDERLTATELSYQLTLEEVISKRNGFELFASHLVKELSLENILFLMEYMQLKHFVTIHLQSYVTDMGYQVPICPTLVKKYLSPHLVQASLPTSTSWAICLDMFRYLYTQYIVSTSMALLNLSYNSSNTITRQMTELKHNSTIHALQPLIIAFDIAAKDVMGLLKIDPFCRFQLSPECIRYCEELI
ncbi:hypothetical protein RFI_25431, partial [Reticulomyxa filosa]